MITQAELEQIIANMGPILKMHPNERYMPDDADAFLNDSPSRASLIWGRIPYENSYIEFEAEGSLSRVAVAADGTVWGVDQNQAIYRRDGNTWTLIPGKLVDIAVGSRDLVWGVDKDDAIYRRDGTNWTTIPGRLVSISVGKDGTVWGVDRAGAIYRRDGNSWTTIPGTLMQVSVGDANNVWGVNKDGMIFRRDGSSWTRIAGSLVNVDVAADGTVYGVDKNYRLYRRDGDQWTLLAGTYFQVSVGSAQHIWATGRSKCAIVPPPPSGAVVSSWVFNMKPNTVGKPVTSSRQLMDLVAEAKAHPDHADPTFRYRLQIDHNSISGNSARTKAYVTVSHFNSEIVRIAFWYFYPYNGPGKFRVSIGNEEIFQEVSTVGRHYADWEHVTLAVRKTSQGWKLDSVYLSRHDLTIWHSPDKFQYVGQHPIIYVARDSHAHYESAGDHYYKRPWSMDFGSGTAAVDLHDITGNGITIDTSQPGRWVLVAAQEDLTGLAVAKPVWYDYDGRWGQHEPLEFSYTIGMTSDLSYTYVMQEVGAGPTGPGQRDTDEYWRTIPGGLKCVSAAADGTVWGVNSANLIFRRDADTWTCIPGNLVQIAVGGANMVWGVDANDNIYRRDGNAWTTIPGKLVNVAVGADGTVWGVNRDGLIFRRDGNAWTNIAGKLAMISVGSSAHVWGTDRDGNIYRWSGSGWVTVPGKLNTLTVASDGTVWGLARLPSTLVPMDALIYRRDGETWTQVDGGLIQISAGSKTRIWGVNVGNQIFNRS